MLEKDKSASAKYRHKNNLEQFILKRRSIERNRDPPYRWTPSPLMTATRDKPLILFVSAPGEIGKAENFSLYSV